MNKFKRKQNERPQAFWGALIGAGTSLVGGLLGNNAAKKQARLMANQNDYNIALQDAQSATNAYNAALDYQQNYLQQFKQQARLGTTRRLGDRNIMITDGGNAKRIGNNTYLLRGGSHEDINETGQTGIGINVGGNEIEAEGGEVAQRKGNSLRIYSAQPILGGISPAQAIMRGYNKDKVFNAQQRFKKNNGIKDDGSQQRNGGLTSKDRGSSKHPYPSVASKDFAGGNRSYPIPTKADAIDALRLAGLHGRSDVRSKVYSKYPELRKKAGLGDWIKGLFSDNNSNAKNKVVYRSARGKVFNTFREASRDNYKYYKEDPVYRYYIKGRQYHKKYGLRELNIPFQKENAITIRNGGRASGAVVSPNQLDTIAKYATRAGLSIPTALGLAIKESTLNNATDTKSAAKLKGLKVGTKAYENWTTGQHIQGSNSHKGTSSARSWINFHKDDDLNPYWETIDYLNTYSNISTIDEYNKRLLASERYDDRRGNNAPKLTGGKKINVLEYGFRDYKNNPKGYNPKQSNYVQLVNQNARDIMKSPQIQQWYKNSRYTKGRKYKCGGRIKAEDGTRISLTSSYSNKDFLHRITQGHPTARKIVNEIFGDEADRRRFIQDLNIFGYGSEDASSIAGASPIFRRPIVSAARQAQFIQNANKARQAANADKARQAANYAQQQVDYIKKLSDRMSATMRNVGEQLGIRVNPNTNNSVRRLYSSNFKPANTNNRITTPRETPIENPINSSNSFTETPINPTTNSANNTYTYSGKTTKFNTKYRSYRDAGFSPKTSKNLVKANKLGLYGTIGGLGTIGFGTLIGSNIDKTNKTNKANKAQLDAKGKPISPYIARPQEPAKPQAKKVVSTRKDTTRTDTTKQVNKVVKRQVRTTPQYTGNTTRGNYQLHDGETKVINGIKYTRRGNTIINHKTNVGYIYDKNGNYTGQADYSKVGNFNQAFDAARAAGRNQFIYRAGKYNNYSTAKETNAKKEALNRRIGARRIAKRIGGITNPPVERFKCGGRIRPKAEDGMLAPIYSYGNDRRRLPSFAPIDITPRAIPNFKPVSVPTNTKTPFDPNSVPFLGNRSTFKPATQDYIGLGIDTLAALGSGLINYNSASKTYIPKRTSIIQSSKLPTYYNISPQVEEIRRQRNKAFDDISHNTSSSVAAINRMNRIASDSALGIDKLYATKENEENKMLTQDALNQQSVAAENAKLQADYEANKANILNAQNQAKADAINLSLSGLSQAWTNFAGSVESRYDNRQKEAIIAATAKDPAVLSNAVQFGYNFSPEVLAAIYNSTDDDNLKSLALSQLSTKNRLRYGIR